jgi:hypothetical protein
LFDLERVMAISFTFAAQDHLELAMESSRLLRIRAVAFATCQKRPAEGPDSELS